jgi:type IV secretion system protein VirB6
MAGQSTAKMLDALWHNVGKVSALLQDVTLYQIGCILLGFVMFLMNCILFILALFYMTIAKFGLVITMVLLPLFIGFLVFEQTRQWFINWISKMLNFSLIYILVIAIIRFGFVAFGDTIAEAGKAASAANASAVGLPLTAQIYILEGVLIIFMLQVKSWAADLSGGATVQGFSTLITVGRFVKGALPK